MTAIIGNHLVEIIEQLANNMWVVYDTVTGLTYEVSTEDITQSVNY